MDRVEIVIDANVELITVHVGRPASEVRGCIVAVHTTDKPDAGGIQPIAGCESVRQRHLGNQRLHVSGRIKSRSQWIAVEDAERSQRTCRAARSYGVAVQVNWRVAGNGVSALHTREISEDAPARLRSQD